MKSLALVVALSMVGAVAHGADVPAPAADVIWIEGEDAARSDVVRHGWYDSVKKDVMSGQEWLSHFDENREGAAEYEFEVEEAGEFTFWIRANPLGASLSYKLNGAADWTAIDLARDQRGNLNIASDNRPDLRFLAWVKVGKLTLNAGQHTIAFRMDSDAQNHGGIDCFAFTRIPFIPSGANKPMVRSGPAAADEWFPVVMETDPLDPRSVIDMSRLVEAPAGKHGFLQRRGDALQFERAARPVKFWGVGAPPLGNKPEEMQRAARWLRKHGVNIVRQHTMIDAVGLLDRSGKFDPGRLDRYDRWFAALKEQGIYSTWSVVYPHHGAFLRRWEVDGELFDELDAADTAHDGARGPIVVNDYINLEPALQAVAWKYFDALLSHVNPYTGLAYKDDPALAMLEVQNESNVFFHTLNHLASEPQKMPRMAQRMRQRFFTFVKQKYGSRDAVVEAWGNLRDTDNWDAGELALMGAYHWGSDGPLYEFAGQTRRTGDYIEFLTHIQRNYYERRVKQIRDAGFKGVTVTTAWRAGGPGAELADLYCDTAADAIDRHNYFGGGDGGHRIVEGKVDTATHLSQPGHGLLAVGMFQVAHRPFVYSEWSHMPPNPWKAEAAPLVAFYGMGLQGWDASYHFALGQARIGDGWPGQGKYTSHTPHYLGQFPALAMAIHQGHIREGEVVALRQVTVDDIFAGRDVLGQSLAGGGHDAKRLTGSTTTPPLALAAGRVLINLPVPSDEPPQLSPEERLLTPLVDDQAKTITSTTGQLVWHYGARRFEIRSAKTQGVVGFVGGETLKLPAAEVTVTTPFVSLLFTPLDDLPLAESRKILVTAMARDKQTGSEFNDDWSELKSIGGPPLLMEPVQATIRLAGDRPTRVRALDLYGVPGERELEIAPDGGFRIDGGSETYYYEVTR